MNPEHNSVKRTLDIVVSDIQNDSLEVATLILAIRQLSELLEEVTS